MVMKRLSWLGGMGTGLLLLTAGCQGDDDGIVQNGFGEDFVSDAVGDYGRYEQGYGAEDGGETGGEVDAPTDDGDGAREISEADIVVIEGNRLYALSTYGGLAVIDISNPETLPILGRARTNANPFEMYVENGQVFMLMTNFIDYSEVLSDVDIASEYVESSSRLVAFDASDPSNIVERGVFEVPGTIQDSRRVGDILYLVSHENDYCWGCDEGPSTTVLSLDVTDPTAVVAVDKLRFEDESDYRRSVTSTTERLYIAGYDYSWNDDDNENPGGSTIDVVDISDPAGTLVKGASIEISGQIQSRWQMNEYNDVLRVISQPSNGFGEPPKIETFGIQSSADFSPLGVTEMVLPRPEELQSVRFDGDHAYAITFEQTDPLFTIDLSDPATPRQIGELEIPGWVYHMETRDNYVLGVGYDQNNPDGSLNVSLFDVSDFENPALIDREHFGGSWGYFNEDQDRIHKSFRILDDLGMIVVPYSGWGDDGCYSDYVGGVQLVDWEGDALTLRGVAPSGSRSRRALVHDGYLLGVSDTDVEAFDIEDRDTPERVSKAVLSSQTRKIADDGETAVRLSNSWWTSHAELEVLASEDADSDNVLGRIDLSSELAHDEYNCWYGWSETDVLVDDGYAYLVESIYGYGDGYPESEGENSSRIGQRIQVVDVRDPAQPSVVSSLDVPLAAPFGDGDYYFSYSSGRTSPAGRETSLAIVGDALVIDQRISVYGQDDQRDAGAWQVVDISNPAALKVGTTIVRDEGSALGGLRILDDSLFSWHASAVDDDPTKVRFFADIIDVSSPSSAQVVRSINVPGIPVAYYGPTQRLVTSNPLRVPLDVSSTECWSYPNAYENDESGTCEAIRYELNLLALNGNGATLLDTVSFDGVDEVLQGIAVTDRRLFVGLAHFQNEAVDSNEEGVTLNSRVLAFDDWSGSELGSPASVDLSTSFGWTADLFGVGTSVYVNFSSKYMVTEIDTSDFSSPKVSEHSLYGRWCEGSASESNFFCVMGGYGVQMFSPND